MTLIAQHLPVNVLVPLDRIISDVAAARAAGLAPFAPETVAALSALSAALLRDSAARRFPAIQALAFWLRPAAIAHLSNGFTMKAPQNGLRMPRGVVLHIPPANVDTIFVYSWALALLTGNCNIVRLPQQRSEQMTILIDVLRGALKPFPNVAAHTVMVAYGHETEITGALSAAADMRVIWGGDRTVNQIRAVALPPHATEIAFGDRFSLAALKASAVAALDDQALAKLAEAFYNDVFWFNQMACSSPRLVFWVGDAAVSTSAAERFLRALVGIVKAKEYSIDQGSSVNKLSYVFRAILDFPVSKVESFGSALSLLTLSQMVDMRDESFGAGTLFQHTVPEIRAIVQHVRRKDQTLTQFGFTRDEIESVARELNGRGLDRIVPIGEALNFDSVWDGFDLLEQFTRLVSIG